MDRFQLPEKQLIGSRFLTLLQFCPVSVLISLLLPHSTQVAMPDLLAGMSAMPPA